MKLWYYAINHCRKLLWAWVTSMDADITHNKLWITLIEFVCDLYKTHWLFRKQPNDIMPKS